MALTWDELSRDAQLFYLKEHPKSKRRLTAKSKINKEDKAVRQLSSIIKKSPFRGKAFLAGGFVRDKILGRLSKDIDITVEAPSGGIDLANYISKKLKIHEPVIFPTFGTAKIQLPSGVEVEFVQTRNEEYVRGSRKPSTSFGTLQEDVERRDFTINTLLLDLTTGKTLDLTGKGMDDLREGIIRTPLDPNVTFQDDPLRILRSVRFAVKYDFKFADDVLPAVKNNAEELNHISRERIQEELNKMLATKKPSRALNVMLKTGVLHQFLPELERLVGVKQGKYHYTDAWNHTMDVLDRSNDMEVNKVPVDRLAALLHDIGKPQKMTVGDDSQPHFYEHEKASADIAEEVMKRLKYSNDVIDKVTKIIASHMRVHGSSQWSDATVRRFIRDMGLELDNVLNLIKADRASHHPDYASMVSITNLEQRIKELQSQKPVEKMVLPITGHEIMDVLKLQPGPAVGKAKEHLQNLLLDNPDMTKQQAIEALEKLKIV